MLFKQSSVFIISSCFNWFLLYVLTCIPSYYERLSNCVIRLTLLPGEHQVTSSGSHVRQERLLSAARISASIREEECLLRPALSTVAHKYQLMRHTMLSRKNKFWRLLVVVCCNFHPFIIHNPGAYSDIFCNSNRTVSGGPDCRKPFGVILLLCHQEKRR
ncbi:hypothetical protein A359_01800 [secondary endosymbiont of Ctenarytaina eucalypti]|uniref:Uncharacterized protein n=1 Tax=secondary endosymbiont of Ctenarytaina eucalypti TaxID=1199245 RepID=J3TF11_9ENTR|nr:hypothetical protein A359_01800 [secondary endosymbiont of Ctenarytaina eucalypti]